MAAETFTLSTEWEQENGAILEVEAEITIHSWDIDPGRYYGPPENCWPASSECETECTDLRILSIAGAEVVRHSQVLEHVLRAFEEEHADLIEEKAWEEIESRTRDYAAEAAEARWEARRDFD